MRAKTRLDRLERTRRTDPVVIWWTLGGDDVYHGPNGATRTAAELPGDARHIVLTWGDDDAVKTTPG
jgi:hypothetical protein